MCVCYFSAMRKEANLESVDNALRLLLMLGAHERIRVSDVASALGVAASTSHRLLATLKYRGFVEQQPDRTYTRGPAFQKLSGAAGPARSLEEIALPVLTRLKDEVDETTHVMVRRGSSVHFLASIEATQALRVTSRAGAQLQAHRTSGGKAMLAELPETELDQILPPEGAPDLSLDASAVAKLRRDLAGIRSRGYGVNRGEGERGIAAVGMCIHDDHRRPVGAISISVPTVRFGPPRLRELVEAARRA